MIESFLIVKTKILEFSSLAMKFQFDLEGIMGRYMFFHLLI